MTTIEKKSLRVGKYVDMNHVDTLIRTYKQERWSQNSDRIGKEDSLSIWYSVEEMEEFIQKAKKAGANGVRMHFGVYPENFAKTEAANQMTIVMVANKQKVTEAGGIEEKNVYIHAETGAKLLAYNYGGICPTQCPSGRSGDDSDDWGGIGVTLVDRGDKGLAVV